MQCIIQLVNGNNFMGFLFIPELLGMMYVDRLLKVEKLKKTQKYSCNTIKTGSNMINYHLKLIKSRFIQVYCEKVDLLKNFLFHFLCFLLGA